MFFMVKNEDVLDKYNEIWNRIEKTIKNQIS